MISPIDRIKREVTIEDLLAFYGWDGRDFGRTGTGYTTVLCPFHDDRSPSARYSEDRDRFDCYACDVHGDVIDVVRHMEFLDVRGAIEWIETNFRL